MFVQAEAFVVPPPLFGIVMIFVRFETKGNRSVFRDAEFVGVFEFLDELGGIVDVG